MFVFFFEIKGDFIFKGFLLFDSMTGLLFGVWCYTGNVCSSKMDKKKAFCFAAAFSLKDMKHPKHRDRETSEKT